MEDNAGFGAAAVADGALTWLLNSPWYWYLALLIAAVVVVAALLASRAERLARQRMEENYRRQASERAQAMRREVYLPAAEAIARAQEFVGKLPGLDLSQDGVQVVVDYVVGALGKVHLVGSDATLRATLAVSTEFTAAHLALSARRAPIDELQNEVDALDAKARHLSVERDQLLASITRMAGDGMEQHAAMWSDMNLRFDKLHREIANLLARRGDKVAALTKLRQQYTLEAAQHALRLSKLSVPAYLALRGELDLPLDEVEYRGMAQRRIAEIERQLKQLSDPEAAKPEATKSMEEPRRPVPAKPEADAAPSRLEGRIEPKLDPRPELPHEARLRMVLKKG